MAKSENQKLKLLYILKILYKYTDETHSITTQELIEKLEAYGIKAERKSIYADFAALDDFGLSVEKSTKDGKVSYFLADKVFELPELKLLVDIVQSAKFITEKKSNSLIKKIEQFSSRYESNLLQRQVFVADRVKTMNESIYYNIDALYQAMNANKKISFSYYTWNVDKTLKPRRNGDRYTVSPWALTWDDENYYLIAYDGEEKKEKFFRVDKMKDIASLDESREGAKAYEKFNLAKFSKKTFGMFGGESKKVTLEVDNSMVGVIFDRFGLDIPVIKVDENTVRTIVEASVSRQFISWIISLGEGVKIVEPQSVLDAMQEEIKRLSQTYGKQ